MGLCLLQNIKSDNLILSNEIERKFEFEFLEYCIFISRKIRIENFKSFFYDFFTV